MVGYKKTFARREERYLIRRQDFEKFLARYQNYLMPDVFFESFIQNIYFDTDNFDLIRGAYDKYPYKEKLRLRTYGMVTDLSTVFIEIKKKTGGIVYKRRTSLPHSQIGCFMDVANTLPSRVHMRQKQELLQQKADNQVFQEILWAQQLNQLVPKVYIAYHRLAYRLRSDNEFRLTFDDEVYWRIDDLSLTTEPTGINITPPEMVIMEIKATNGFPLWLTEFLSSHQIFPTTFSKYKACQRSMLLRGVI